MKKLFLGFAVVAMSFISCDSNKKKDANAEEEMNAMESTEGTMSESDSDMQSNETVADIVMAKDDFSTLKGAVQQAGLVEVLQSDGPFTVLAPTNNAFSKLPEQDLNDLLKPQNKEKLTSILNYHVIPGEYAASDITQAINDNNGEYEINTVEGDKLTASLEDDKVILTDANGGKATVEQTDIKASNGVVHVVNTVLMPESATGTTE